MISVSCTVSVSYTHLDVYKRQVDHGEIVQQGTHDELVAVDGLYRRFVVERQQAAGWKV